ncbi:hypothetical protein [Bradyrhizobium sp. USDA 4454]
MKQVGMTRGCAFLPKEHTLAARTLLYWTDLRDETIILSQFFEMYPTGARQEMPGPATVWANGLSGTPMIVAREPAHERKVDASGAVSGAVVVLRATRAK